MDIAKEYIDLIKNRKHHFYDDYKKTIDKVSHSTAIYHGKPIPFLYQPMFYNKKDMDKFEEIVRILISIANKIVKHYFNNPSFRKKFGFNRRLEDLILVDQGYPINVTIGRFDIFYDGLDNFKFCELNTDGSSAMNEDNTLAKIMLESEPIKQMNEKYEITYFELFNKWVDESIRIYQQFCGKVTTPNVAIVDFKESAITYEFKAFKEAFINKGYHTIICDPRDLRYKSGKLYYNDMQVDLIYRRIVTKELIDHYEELSDLIEAYKDKAVCMIGSLKSQIIHNKIIFKILHEADTLTLLNKEEQAFIKKHVPLTQEFSRNNSLYQEIILNKDAYILKPKDSYGSRGVYAGLDYSPELWMNKVKETYDNDYLVEEYCIPYQKDFIVYRDKDIKVESFKHIIGLFSYNEKFAGLYTRIGKDFLRFFG